MIDIRRKDIKVRVDRRENPRLEFHCTAVSSQVKKAMRITDLSFGGVFLELKDKRGIKLGNVMDLAIKFPTEQRAIMIKVVVSNISDRGIGCMFKNLSPQNHAAVKRCFETFKDTIPLP